MKKSVVFIVVCFYMLFSNCVFAAPEEIGSNNGQTSVLCEQKVKDIDEYVNKQIGKGKIPGVSLTIVEGDKIAYKKGFGFSDLKEKRIVTGSTLFELGSSSKAFTGLGILRLVDQGLINLDDNVNKYIPWFAMYYQEEKVNISIRQLLYHTSGIQFRSIGDIPVSEENSALESTVRTLTNKDLDFYPGERFQYATINYDVLGLIIQIVSGQSYEDYMKNNILKPYGLNNTYIYKTDLHDKNKSKGYKIGFLKPLEYSAPNYRGNVPAGYFITCADDLAKWLMIQLGTYKFQGHENAILERTHIADRTVAPGPDGSSYAAGWFVYQDGSGELSHEGSNPNFSSYIVFRPQEKIGVGILSNMNTSYTKNIGQGIMDILMNKTPNKVGSDLYRGVDNVSVALLWIILPLGLASLFFLALWVMQLIRGKRKFVWEGTNGIISFVVSILVILAFIYCIYRIPDGLFMGLSWSFVVVWAPISFIALLVSLGIGGLLFYLYFLLTKYFPEQKDFSIFTILVLTVISGLGNALIIFIINAAFTRANNFSNGMIIYFASGLLIYITGQIVVRKKMNAIINDIACSRRIDLIGKMFRSTFQELQKIDSVRIHDALNGDTEAVSGLTNVAVNCLTNVITLLCCFIYLGIINSRAVIISILAIFIAAGTYYMFSRAANKIWVEARQMRDEFFRLTDHLIMGFKELIINSGKQKEFKKDIVEHCIQYKGKRTKAGRMFTNVFVVGELLFTFVIGIVIFILPLLFHDIQIGSLRNYVVVFLFMNGPVNYLLSAIPEITQIRISWGKINGVTSDLGSIDVNRINEDDEWCNKTITSIRLKDVVYKYGENNEDSFVLGPVSCEFKSGEITFITGGNGSGKSTLSKLLTGLYVPDSGMVLIDGNNAGSKKIGEVFSTVFSDFYIFQKLYGIDFNLKHEEIEKYLKLLRIEGTVKIENGVINTVKLSTGQRKRLALLISYLEDKSIFLFDEWAADQEPEFRKFFYEFILPDLKSKGKCIIVITHDDRYFCIADKVIKLDMGMVVS